MINLACGVIRISNKCSCFEIILSSNIVLFGLSLLGFPSRFVKTCLLRRDFHTLIKNVSFSSPTNVGSHNPPPSVPSALADTCFLLNRCRTPQSTPLRSPTSFLAHHLVSTPFRGSTSSLAHRPLSSSDTICNNPSPPLVDNVLFRLSLSGFSSRFLKRVC